MTHLHSPQRLTTRHIMQIVLLISLLIGLPSLVVPTNAQAEDAPTMPGAPAWLEPRGLNIVDLVGQAPEEHLQGAVLTYATGSGILEYISGLRTGDSVEITTRAAPRYYTFGASTFTKIGCLGQSAANDQLPSTSPASTVRVLNNGQDVTGKVVSLSVIPAGQVLPTNNPSSYYRYPEPGPTPVSAQNGVVAIPANMGCTINLDGKYAELTAIFTVVQPQTVHVTHLGSQTFAAHSYIGVGGGGILDSLNTQMRRKYGERHDKFDLDPPADTEYVFVNFPPTSTDPYTGNDPLNRPLPGSGTYRFQGVSGNNRLSVDHVAAIGLPLFGQWQDSDQTGNSQYLTYFTDAARLASVEYFLPPGIPYDPCMTSGGCTNDLLDQINEATYNITVHYYKVERIIAEGLDRIPLKMVGKGWSATNPLAAFPPMSSVDLIARPSIAEEDSIVYLPLITFTEPEKPIPPDDSSGCPCGWFDANGRMVDFIQQP